MSALLLGLATLDRKGDQWIVSTRSRQVLEDVILDMNRIVSELIHEDPKLLDRPDTNPRIAPPEATPN